MNNRLNYIRDHFMKKILNIFHFNIQSGFEISKNHVYIFENITNSNSESSK